jgi:hypothetical protein
MSNEMVVGDQFYCRRLLSVALGLWKKQIVEGNEIEESSMEKAEMYYKLRFFNRWYQRNTFKIQIKYSFAKGKLFYHLLLKLRFLRKWKRNARKYLISSRRVNRTLENYLQQKKIAVLQKFFSHWDSRTVARLDLVSRQRKIFKRELYESFVQLRRYNERIQRENEKITKFRRKTYPNLKQLQVLGNLKYFCVYSFLNCFFSSSFFFVSKRKTAEESSKAQRISGINHLLSVMAPKKSVKALFNCLDFQNGFESFKRSKAI